MFERGQLYNSGSECDEQYKRKLEHLRERNIYKRDDPKSDLYTKCSR